MQRNNGKLSREKIAAHMGQSAITDLTVMKSLLCSLKARRDVLGAAHESESKVGGDSLSKYLFPVQRQRKN
jgi:hypothetical protein